MSSRKKSETLYICLCHNIVITLIRHAHFCWYSSIYSGGSPPAPTHTSLYPSSRFPPNLWHIVLWANVNLLSMFSWIIYRKIIWKIQSVSENFLAYSELPISKMYMVWHPNNSFILDALMWVLWIFDTKNISLYRNREFKSIMLQIESILQQIGLLISKSQLNGWVSKQHFTRS